MTTIDWNSVYAAIWRPRLAALRPVIHLDNIGLDELLGIDDQKTRVCINTERFIHGQAANNVLLWGARGTGKSSMIKALLNEYKGQGLRIVQVEVQDLINLAEIVDELRELPCHFIIYCDDLSLDASEPIYKNLKSVLEGSIELPPKNVLLYATSNRRHLVPESMQDNRDSRVIGDILHYADAIEEKVSLSDRFGLWVSFHPIKQDVYLMIVDSMFPQQDIDRQTLHEQALAFGRERGGLSGRVARQFQISQGEKNPPDGGSS